MKHLKLTGAVAGATLALSVSASAAPTLNWDWLMVAAWDNPVLSGDQSDLTQARAVNYTMDGVNVAGHATIGWGEGATFAGQSSLIIADAAKTSDDSYTGLAVGPDADSPIFNEGNATYGIPAGDRDALSLTETSPGFWSGSVTGTTYVHLNNIVRAASDTLLSVDLSRMFFLSPEPFGTGPVFSPDDNPAVIDIRFLETHNDGTCEVNVAGPNGECDDIFIVSTPGVLSFDFLYEGYRYDFSVVSQDPDPLGDDTGLTSLPDEACDAVGLSIPDGMCYGLVTGEALDNLFGFDLVLTARKVSEPSILALMGIGLLGAGYVRRRKQNA